VLAGSDLFHYNTSMSTCSPPMSIAGAITAAQPGTPVAEAGGDPKSTAALTPSLSSAGGTEKTHTVAG